ncbi:MAG TPA: phosphoribosylanthranilate isomerase [Acetobacteraceae bacterium]|jgi:phosphoribosylanthranilate isomerase|nr:phosphoribosylanthranilate isomerase [Acetobacteraceae bacterium]
MTRVKICGINDPVGFDTAVEAGADWVGFVFFPPSPRYVPPPAAAALSGRIKSGPPRVGLFVEPTLVAIAEVLAQVKLDVLQIYGARDQLAAIKSTFGLPLWRAVGVSTAADLPADALGADRLLIEAKPPAGSNRPGGNATRFDWPMMQGWKPPAPWMLAGGLTPDNVATAIRETGARAVDVSSGVESRKGVKDPALIRAFITAAKAAQ